MEVMETLSAREVKKGFFSWGLVLLASLGFAKVAGITFLQLNLSKELQLICAQVITFLPFFLYRGKYLVSALREERERFSWHITMRWFAFAVCFTSTYGLFIGQLLFRESFRKIEEALGSVGSGGQGDISLGLLLIVTVFAPILEELTFRGVLLQGLKRYGENFAVVASAFLFGLAHYNLYQFFLAFGLGIVLGYGALRYSLRFSILLHILNNSLGGLFAAFTGLYLFLVLFVLVELWRIKRRNPDALRELYQFFHLNPWLVKRFFLSPPILLYCLMIVWVFYL